MTPTVRSPQSDTVSQYLLIASVLDPERERETWGYKVDAQYDSYWTAAKVHNYCSIMPVFDTSEAPISPDHFAEKLVGVMCEITFTLKHYAIASHRKADGSVVEANNIFLAQVETVDILKTPSHCA